MNSNKVIVSGKNATTSIFITIAESQKEEAERVEYEIKNSHTSTEEEAEIEDDEDDEYMHDSEEEEQDLKDKYEQGLKDKIETLQLSVTNHEKKYECLQNLYCEEKQRRIDAYKENTELEAKVKELKKKADEDFKEEDKIFWKHKNEIERLNKELKTEVEAHYNTSEMRENYLKELRELRKERDEREPFFESARKVISDNVQLRKELDELKNDTCDYNYIHVLDAQNKTLKETIRKLHVSLSKMTKQYNKQTIELKEERIFRRDNEDNFFRLLDEHRRLEKVMKNVTI